MLTLFCNRIKNKIMIACKCLGAEGKEEEENLPSVFFFSFCFFPGEWYNKTKEFRKEESHVTNCEFPNDEYSARIDQKKK